MIKTIIKIEGVSDMDCAKNVLRALSRVPKVKGANVSDGSAIVLHEGAEVDLLLQVIQEAGNCRGSVIESQPIQNFHYL